MTQSLRRWAWGGLLVYGVVFMAAPRLAAAQNAVSVVSTPSSGNAYAYQRYVTGSRGYEVGVGAGGVSDVPNSLFIYDEQGGQYRLVITPNGSVGIGTTNPGGLLHVKGSGNVLQSLETSGTGGAYAYQRYVTGSRAYEVGVGAGGTEIPNSLFIWDEQANNYRLVINASGNVGIGTLNPVAKFHVAGDAQVDGNLAAKYQDVAEWVQTSAPLPSGVVVVVDPQNRNQGLPSSASYDTKVAGVVSARPGLLLGEGGDSKVKVAHSGRVRVRVDASYAPVAVGDLLVTSPTAGYAMRSNPVDLGGTSIHRPGTLLGKALEPLDAGQGEILVLLTLQ